jgi:anti-repressor protein
MSLPQVFNNAGMEVRVVVVDETPWWVAADVITILGLANGKSTLHNLDDDEKGVHTVNTPGGDQSMTIVNESGLYSLILRSRKPEAKAFKRWITHEVLPAIRKTGGYQKPITELSRIDLAKMVIAAEQEKAALEARIEKDAPKVAFAEAVSEAINGLEIAEFSKVCGIPDMGPVNMFRAMKRLGIIFYKNDRPVPYQEFIDRGYFKLSERKYTKRGETMVYHVILVTGKGQQWLYKVLQTKDENKALLLMPPHQMEKAS